MPAHQLPSAGLDFGTSTTLYANSRADVIPIGAGGARAWMPSLIGFPGGGARVLAEQAESLGHHAPASVLRSVKRYITRGVTSVGAEGPASAAGMSVDHLIADLLREAWARAQSNYATLGTDSVLRLGCPAMWDGRQRSHLLAAAQQAGVPVGHAVLIDEPIAAGIAWLASRSEPFDDPKRIVVFDMGGGTLDIAVLHVQGTKVAVLAAHGRGEAGDKLDQTIAAELQHALVAHGALRAAASKAQAAEILRAARDVKEGLSDFNQQPLTLDPRDFPLTQDIWYTRAELEQAFAPQMDRAQHTVERALRVARVSAHEAMGELLARLHLVLAAVMPPVEAVTATVKVPEPDKTKHAIDRYLDVIASRAGRDAFDARVERRLRHRRDLLERVAHLRPVETALVEPYGWVHGDFHDLNLLWHGGEVVAVIDWDRLSVRPLAAEVVRAATLLFTAGDDAGLDLEQVATFAAAYRRVRPLAVEQLTDAAARLWWERVCDLWQLKRHYDQHDTSCDHLFISASALVEWWSDHRLEVTSAFAT